MWTIHYKCLRKFYIEHCTNCNEQWLCCQFEATILYTELLSNYEMAVSEIYNFGNTWAWKSLNCVQTMIFLGKISLLAPEGMNGEGLCQKTV